MEQMNQEIINDLTLNENIPIFWITKPLGYESDLFIVYNFTSYPVMFGNNEVIAYEIEYTYHVCFSPERTKEALEFCRKLRQKTQAEKIMHYYDEEVQHYHAVYEAKLYYWEEED